MARDVNVTIRAHDETRAGVESAQQNLNKLGQNFDRLNKDVGKFKSALTGAFAGFLTFEALKQVFERVREAVKKFDETATKAGKSSMTVISEYISAFEMQVGQLLYPLIEDLAAWMTANGEQVLHITDKILRSGVNCVQILTSWWDTLFNGIKAGFNLVLTVVSANLGLVLELVRGVVNKVPEKFIPDGWKEGINRAADTVHEFADQSKEAFVEGGKKTIDGLKGMKDGAMDLADTLMGPAKTSFEQLNGLVRKNSEESKKAREEYGEYMDTLLSSSQSAFDKVVGLIESSDEISGPPPDLTSRFEEVYEKLSEVMVAYEHLDTLARREGDFGMIDAFLHVSEYVPDAMKKTMQEVFSILKDGQLTAEDKESIVDLIYGPTKTVKSLHLVKSLQEIEEGTLDVADAQKIMNTAFRSTDQTIYTSQGAFEKLFETIEGFREHFWDTEFNQLMDQVLLDLSGSIESFSADYDQQMVQNAETTRQTIDLMIDNLNRLAERDIRGTGYIDQYIAQLEKAKEAMGSDFVKAADQLADSVSLIKDPMDAARQEAQRTFLSAQEQIEAMQATIQEAYARGIMSEEQFVQASTDLDAALVSQEQQLQDRLTDITAEGNRERIEEQTEYASKIIGGYMEMFSGILQFQDAYIQGRKQRELEDIKNMRVSSKKRQKLVQEANDRYAAEEKEAAERKQWLSAGEIVISGAKAVAKEAEKGWLASAPFIALQMGLTATQLATVWAQSFADGGIFQGTSSRGDKNWARMNDGEMVLNKRQQSRLFAIADGRSSSGGSGASVTIGGDTIVVQPGADAEMVRRELAASRERKAREVKAALKDLMYRGQVKGLAIA